jgi:hypothetical protein
LFALPPLRGFPDFDPLEIACEDALTEPFQGRAAAQIRTSPSAKTEQSSHPDRGKVVGAASKRKMTTSVECFNWREIDELQVVALDGAVNSKAGVTMSVTPGLLNPFELRFLGPSAARFAYLWDFQAANYFYYAPP